MHDQARHCLWLLSFHHASQVLTKQPCSQVQGERGPDCKMHDKVRGPNFGQILSFYLPTIGTSLGK